MKQKVLCRHDGLNRAGRRANGERSNTAYRKFEETLCLGNLYRTRRKKKSVPKQHEGMLAKSQSMCAECSKYLRDELYLNPQGCWVCAECYKQHEG